MSLEKQRQKALHTRYRDEQINLIYDALMDLGRIQCDCDRVVDPSRSISPEDVERWLDKRHIKEVTEIAEKYQKNTGGKEWK